MPIKQDRILRGPSPGHGVVVSRSEPDQAGVRVVDATCRPKRLNLGCQVNGYSVTGAAFLAI
jgi:hypothetical protein